MYEGPIEVLPVEHDLYELTKNEPALPDPYLDFDGSQDSVAGNFEALVAPVIKTSEEAADYLRHQHEIGSAAWTRMCLALQRIARNCPAAAATAYIAANMVPDSHRIYHLDNFRRGMVGFSWVPGNPGAGHIFYIIGRNNQGTILTWTNDARQAGHVDVVDIDFYHREWGHELQFAADWLNGYAFPDFSKHPTPKPEPVVLGDTYRKSLQKLHETIQYHKAKDHKKLVKQLEDEYHRMKDLLDKWAA